MRLSEQFIEEVVERTDIEELVGRYVTLKRSGSNNLIGLCPFHSERTPSFSVAPAKKMFYCFGCHAGGSAITFVQKVENLDFFDAVEFLAGRAGIPMPAESDQRDDRRPAVTRKRILEMNLDAAKFFRECLYDPKYGSAGLQYLRETRGLSDAAIKHFGLGFAPNDFGVLTDHMHRLGYRDEELKIGFLCGISEKTGRAFDYFRNRVIFPIIDTLGNVVAFGGRVMDDSKPKYLNTSDTPAFKKSNQLFALNFARNYSAEQMILCEGYMDVIALHAAGFENAVATLGTAITPNHARIFSKYTKKVIISYDADEAGQNAAKKAMYILGEVGLEVRVLKIPDAKDPDEFIRKYGSDRFRRVLNESKTGFEHQLEGILSKYNLTVGADKIRASGEVCKMIASYPSAIEREVYLSTASGRLELPKEVLQNTVSSIRNKSAAERKKQEMRQAQATLKNFGDRINTEAAKNPKAAAAEECFLGLLLIYPEYRNAVLKREIEVETADFQSDFHKRVFEAIMKMENTEEGFRYELLGAEFNPDEMGRIRKMEVTRQELTQNGTEVLRSAVGIMKELRKEEELDKANLSDRLAYLREKKLHKGRVEPK